jgi:hypothetical protein
MAAGAAKRFEMFDASGVSIPKPLAPVDGIPNLARTVLLVQKHSPGTEVFISMPPERIDRYRAEVSKHCTGFTAFIGERYPDGYKFPNVMAYVVSDTVILYGDCRYEEEDIVKMFSDDPPDCDVIGMRREKDNPSCVGKRYQEHYAWRIFSVALWTEVVEKTFKHRGERCTSHVVWASYKGRKVLTLPSFFTDDFDKLSEYTALMSALAKRDREG